MKSSEDAHMLVLNIVAIEEAMITNVDHGDSGACQCNCRQNTKHVVFGFAEEHAKHSDICP
jgi:hypothetical protein